MLEETFAVIYILFRPLCDAYHGFHCLHGISTRRRLPGQHDRTCAVIHRIGNIRSFRSCRAGILDHGFQHLGSRDHLLAGTVNLFNDLLLNHRHFLVRNLHSHVSSCHHNTV